MEGRARRHVATGYQAATGLAAAALAVWAAVASVPFLSTAPEQFWILALIALLVDVPRFVVPSVPRTRARSTMAVCFTLAIAVLWGLAPAIVVQALAAGVSTIGQRNNLWLSIPFVSRHVLALTAAVLVVQSAFPNGELTDTATGLTGRGLLLFALMAATWLAFNLGLMLLAGAFLSGHGLSVVTIRVREDLLFVTTSILLVEPLITTVGGWWSVLVALPLFVWNGLELVQLRSERRLIRDEVSGLLSRRGLSALINELTYYDDISSDGPPPFGLVLVNVNPVWEVNRTLGRTWSDKLVREIAGRLRAAYGADVGRLAEVGAIIVRPGLTVDDALAEGEYARRLLAEPITVGGIPFDVDPAAGVALSPAHGRSFEELLSHAEQAMNEARRQGVPAKLYEQRETRASIHLAAILSDVHAALQDPERAAREITVSYQPQVGVRTGDVCGVEALARWTHPQWGPVPSEDLYEAIEPSEVIHLMTRHVLNTALRQARVWNTQGFSVRVAVNVSAKDLNNQAIIEDIDTALHRHRVPPAQLTIEMTERMALDDPRVTWAAERIAGLGVRLSLDDFGTGHTSMQQLRDLPLTELKIDKSYVARMLGSPADRAIVTSMHEVARALDLDVVSEGVEDERTAQALTEMPIPAIAQGWHFGRPMTPEEFERWRHETGRGPSERPGHERP